MNRTYLVSLHTEAREELLRVDTKIGVLLQTFMVTISVVGAGAVAGQWNPATELERPGEVLWWMGVSLVGLAVALLLIILNPVTSHSEVRTDAPRYYGDIKRYSTKKAFREALGSTTELSVEDRLVDQTFVLSNLVGRKYAGVHWATGLYVAGVALSAIGAVIK
jgi:hypothetical protein